MTGSLAGGWRPRRGDAGSLPLAMLLTIVGVGLSVVMLNQVSLQQRTTRLDLQRTDAINAAQTGLNVALAQIRAAVNADDSGNIAALPCHKADTISPAYPKGYAFTGTVSVGGAASYTTEIYYLTSSPTGGDIAWARTTMMACGAGTAAVPRYALIASTGTGGPEATRTMYATYSFSSTISNPHIAGGQIRVFRYDSTDPEYCLSSLVDSPAVGDPLWTKVCDDTSVRQEFAYEANLNLVLVSSRTTANPRGMCLDGGSPQADGNTVRFQPCSATTVARQQWGENDYSAFQGTTDGVTLNTFCINVATPNTSSVVKLGSTAADESNCYVNWNDRKTMFPDADVGTGRAGVATGQLVNNDQFGRCIDITADDVSYEHLIVYPCKQNPSGRIQWNQEWDVPTIAAGATTGTGPIYTTCPASWSDPPCANGEKYCLTSPGSVAPGKYVRVDPCPPGATPANMTWTYRKDTGFYSSSYRIESTYGVTSDVNHCLSPTDPDAYSPDFWYTFDVPFSKLALAPCTSSDLQKWNVSQFTVNGPLKDIAER
jgi:Tfp pilus assembly protein PilX